MDKTALGRKIKALRTEANLTQAELEDRSGVSERLIQQIEAGTGNPGIDYIVSLEGVLGPLIGLVGAPGVSSKSAGTVGELSLADFEELMREHIAPKLTRADKHLLTLYRTLDAEGRDSVLALAEDLAPPKQEKLPRRRTRS